MNATLTGQLKLPRKLDGTGERVKNLVLVLRFGRLGSGPLLNKAGLHTF